HDHYSLSLHDALPILALGHGLPRIGLDLLDAEGDALVVLVHVQDLRLDGLALLEKLGGVPDVASPRHVRDVQELVHAGLELDERSEEHTTELQSPDDL